MQVPKDRNILLDEIKITADKRTVTQGILTLAIFVAGFFYIASRK